MKTRYFIETIANSTLNTEQFPIIWKWENNKPVYFTTKGEWEYFEEYKIEDTRLGLYLCDKERYIETIFKEITEDEAEEIVFVDNI